MVQNMILVNKTKKTFITFKGLSKRWEIIFNSEQARMAIYFLFENNGDEVFFLASDWHFGNEPYNLDQNCVFENYRDVTKNILEDIENDLKESS